MRNRSLPAITCVFVLGACILAGPAHTGRTHPEGRRYIGTVVTADRNTGALAARSWRGNAVFDASVARFSGKGGLGTLKPGKRILVRYFEESGRKVATAVMEVAHR